MRHVCDVIKPKIKTHRRTIQPDERKKKKSKDVIVEHVSPKNANVCPQNKECEENTSVLVEGEAVDGRLGRAGSAGGEGGARDQCLALVLGGGAGHALSRPFFPSADPHHRRSTNDTRHIHNNTELNKSGHGHERVRRYPNARSKEVVCFRGCFGFCGGFDGFVCVFIIFLVRRFD